MKLKIGSKEYSFIWGTGAFIKTMDELNMSLSEVQFGIENPKVLFMMTFQALLLWCERNGETCEFEDFYHFVEEYDKLTAKDYEAALNDYLDATYQGATMRKYYQDELGVVFTGDEKGKKKK